MSPPTLLLIRHGQTAWNADRRVLGRTDLPLDEVGLGQAAALAGVLGPVHTLWSSPLSRARQTAAALHPSCAPAPAAVDDDLTEMDQGELDGCGEAELRARFGSILSRWRDDPADLRLPGGETMSEVQVRGLRALGRIAAASAPGSRVAVVTHQLVLSSVLCALRGEPLSAWRTHNHLNTAWTEVVWAPAPVVLAEKVGPHLG